MAMDPQPREEGWGFAADLVDPVATILRFMRRESPLRPRTGLKQARKLGASTRASGWSG